MDAPADMSRSSGCEKKRKILSAFGSILMLKSFSCIHLDFDEYIGLELVDLTPIQVPDGNRPGVRTPILVIKTPIAMEEAQSTAVFIQPLYFQL
jgi:hypothetical protein